MDAAPLVTRRQACLLVAFMWVAYFLNYCDRQAVFAMFPALKSGLGMSDEQCGLLGAVFLWIYAICCPVAGQLGDRFSKRVLVVLSLVVWSAVTISTGFAASAMAVLYLRGAMGISESLYMPTAIALTANAHRPETRSIAISVLTTAQIAGTVAGSWFGGYMADRNIWRDAFFVLGAIGVIYAVPYGLFLRTIKEAPAQRDASLKSSLALAKLVRIPTFLVLCVAFPVFVFGLWLLYGWFPNFLHDKFSLNMEDAAFNAVAYLQSATFVGLVGGGVLADLLYRRTPAARLWLMVVSLLFCAPCLHALGSSASLVGTRCAEVGFGLFSGLLMGNIFPGAFDVVPTETRSSAVGALNTCGGFMSGFATLFGGIWKKSLGIDGLLSVTAVAYLIAGVGLIVCIKTLFAKDYARVH